MKLATDREAEVVWKWIWPVMLNSKDKDPCNRNYKKTLYFGKNSID